MKRLNISSGAEWEGMVGYSRAVRIGNVIEVAGTTAVDGNNVIGKGNMYDQTVFILKKIEKALNECGAQLGDVIRTRIYITDITKWEEAGRAHGEFFKHIRPAATMVEVQNLINPDLMIEIEASAIIDQE